MRLIVTLVALFAMLIAIPGDQAGNLQAARTDPGTKRIALSFDDAPRGRGAFLTEDDRAARLIAALSQAGASQAAFFVNPGRINRGDGDEARLDRYVEAGHVLANHTFTHPKLSRDSAADYLAAFPRSTRAARTLPSAMPCAPGSPRAACAMAM